MISAGTIIGTRYEIIKSGTGEFGDTYLAKDTKLPSDHNYIVKHLHLEDNSPRVLDTARQLFQAKAKILSQLGKQSSQIPTLLAYFEEQGEFYLVEEYIEGNDLAGEIVVSEKLEEAEVIALLKSILEILVVAHELQPYPIIHQDIKPENLIRRRDGKLVLLDFGAVREITQLAVREFCQKLSQKTGKQYRLPSEAEWEYACRAGTTTPFYFGETITPNLVNYNGNDPYGNAPKGLYRKETTEMGILPANAFGLYDMHGNVWEWCSDRWHENYTDAPADGSSWQAGAGDGWVLRGGSLDYDALNCRSANRVRISAAVYLWYYGFRVALDALSF